MADSDVRTFSDLEVTVSLKSDETTPGQTLVHAVLPDGTSVVLLADGSVHEVSASQASRFGIPRPSQK